MLETRIFFIFSSLQSCLIQHFSPIIIKYWKFRRLIMKRKHLFHSFVFLMTGLVTLAFGHVAQADNTTTAESSTSET
ncbi:glutamine ABC transporter permease, partial [Enterococcus faecium]|nr:glutamine ABC transporter permease [Enterococcus faecium]